MSIITARSEMAGVSSTALARLAVLAVTVVIVVFSLFAAAQAAILEVGPGKAFKIPSEAAAKVKDGDHVEIAPGDYFDCAVWRANNLVIEGTAPGVIITDKTCLGKGLFVIEGNDVTVRGLTLQRARVPNNNGAGIRQEGRNLTVDRVNFIDNENGILTNRKLDSTIIISNSDFERNGVCRGDCAHGIYISGAALLRVEHSRFFETHEGHHIKSRATRTEVIACDISDGQNGNSSYLIDVPNGGSLVVRDNKLEKGPKSENPTTAIAIGEEGITYPTKEILIEKNTLRNDGEYKTALVWNVTATPVALKGNKLIGSVTALRDDR